ncbi:MAG TPA: hypothetical protein VFY40_03960 [Blastocatellia bacterium]|nr:hypothetical protein [Blastocatellia bacterium]
MIYAILIACTITITSSISGKSPQSSNPPATENKASADKPPVEILNYKIYRESYPMLDSPGPMAAENGSIPRLPNRASSDSLSTKERRREGRTGSSHSYERGAYGPNLFQVVIRNTGAKTIEVIEWDFLFTHCENDKFVPRFDVTTRVKIKPGGRKTLKSKMPLVSGGCVMPQSLIGELRKQERVLIKRIEYVDGSVWRKQ